MVLVKIVIPPLLCISHRLRLECENSLTETVLVLLFEVEVFIPKENIGGISEHVQVVLKTTDINLALFPNWV